MNPVYYPKPDPRNPGIPLAAHAVYPPTDAASWHQARGAVFKTAAINQTDPRNPTVPLPAHAVYPPTVGGSYTNNGSHGYSAYPQHAVAYPATGPRQVATASSGQLAYPYGPYTTTAGMVHTPAPAYPPNPTYTQAGAASYMQAAAYAHSLSGSQIVHSTTVLQQQQPYHTVYLPEQSPVHGMTSQVPVSAAPAPANVSPYCNRALPPTAVAGAAVGVATAGISPYGGAGLPPGWAYRYPQSQFHPPPQ
ncbi:probable Rho-GTPase-activating protein 7 [Anneissia japonica]|uniref:probable Rho-GTPase-activating protein 7 n=1 Tax=Anneissia japonica TaxID=1529436 RepID=UPI001425A1A6|nr:probable Rho-GTPase-activating protein 7 [Anneissia japonica]